MNEAYVTVGTSFPQGNIDRVEHQCGLPGVHCPECGEVWSSMGLSYPTVSCGAVGPETREPDVVEFSRFVELRNRLRQKIGRVVAPGTSFGAPLIYWDDTPEEIEFYGSWDIFIREGSRAEDFFKQIGLPYVQARTAAKLGQASAVVLAPEIPVLEGLVTTEPACAFCRRFGTVPDSLALRLERAIPVFRLLEYPTVIVWREDLLDTLEGIFSRTIKRHTVAEVED